MNTTSTSPGERTGVAAPTLRTEYVFTARVRVGPAVTVGQGPLGLRRYVPIIGGTVRGPLLNGKVLPGGGDSQILRADGIETDDGVLAMVINRGLRFGAPEVIARLSRGEDVSPQEYYFRTAARMEAPLGSRCDWLNHAILVGTAERTADAAIVHFHRVL